MFSMNDAPGSELQWAGFTVIKLRVSISLPFFSFQVESLLAPACYRGTSKIDAVVLSVFTAIFYFIA